jgi:hypothetical protein
MEESLIIAVIRQQFSRSSDGCRGKRRGQRECYDAAAFECSLHLAGAMREQETERHGRRRSSDCRCGLSGLGRRTDRQLVLDVLLLDPAAIRIPLIAG